MDSDIQSDDYINCHSVNSCANGKYGAKSEINCYGPVSCANSLLFDAQTIALHGTHSGSGSIIRNMGKIEAFGERSLENAIVTSLWGFDAYLYGKEAGNGALITCSSGICSLHCHGDACANLRYICEEGSTCSLFNGDGNEDCVADNSVSVTDDNTVCPNWTNNGKSNGCYAEINAAGDGNMKIYTTPTTLFFDNVDDYSVTYANRIDISTSDIRVRFEVTDTRSVTPKMNHGGFISSIDIVNAAGERLEFMTSNPLSSPYSVALPSDAVLNYNSGNNHCLNPPNGVCNVDQREDSNLPDDAIWIWSDEQRRKSMIFEFDFNEIEDELIAHGCINADYKEELLMNDAVSIGVIRGLDSEMVYAGVALMFAVGLIIVAAFYFYNRSISKQLLEFNDETV